LHQEKRGYFSRNLACSTTKPIIRQRASCCRRVKYIFLHTEELEQELMASPEMAVHMIRYMSGQLREFTSIMRDIALLDVYAKTIKTIERLAEKFGKSKCNEVLIELPLTVQEFASLIGTSRESVSRVFSKLRKEGLIDIKSKKIIILDWCKFCQSKLKDV